MGSLMTPSDVFIIFAPLLVFAFVMSILAVFAHIYGDY
jgi:hypothetical protein